MCVDTNKEDNGLVYPGFAWLAWLMVRLLRRLGYNHLDCTGILSLSGIWRRRPGIRTKGRKRRFVRDVGDEADTSRDLVSFETMQLLRRKMLAAVKNYVSSPAVRSAVATAARPFKSRHFDIRAPDMSPGGLANDLHDLTISWHQMASSLYWLANVTRSPPGMRITLNGESDTTHSESSYEIQPSFRLDVLRLRNPDVLATDASHLLMPFGKCFVVLNAEGPMGFLMVAHSKPREVGSRSRITGMLNPTALKSLRRRQADEQLAPLLDCTELPTVLKEIVLDYVGARRSDPYWTPS